MEEKSQKKGKKITRKEFNKRHTDKLNEMSNARYSLAKHGETMYRNKDLLENLYIVKKYIHWKYGMSSKLLELLLKLYPQGFFNYWDYRKIDKDFRYMHVDYLIELGFIERVVQVDKKYLRNSRKYTYCYGATKKMHDFIDEFYGLLSGEYDFEGKLNISDFRLKGSVPKSLKCLQQIAKTSYFKKNKENKEVYYKSKDD